MSHWHLSREPLEPSAEPLVARSGEGHYSFLRLRFFRGHRNMTVEDFVEAHRPPEKPSRKACWFMCDEVSGLYHASPGPADSKVYLVELKPEAPSRHHFAWIGFLNDVATSRSRVRKKDEATLKEIVQHYWAGTEPPEAFMKAKYDWEVLATRATVLSCCGPTFKGYIR